MAKPDRRCDELGEFCVALHCCRHGDLRLYRRRPRVKVQRVVAEERHGREGAAATSHMIARGRSVPHRQPGSVEGELRAGRVGRVYGREVRMVGNPRSWRTR